MSDALVRAVTRLTDAQAGGSPFATPVDGLTLVRSDHEQSPRCLILKPALCVVVQGAKSTMFGDQRFEYRAGQALVVSVELPAFGRVTEASPEEPFLGAVIEFDLAMMREMMEGLDEPPAEGGDVRRGVFVTDFAGPLADCVLRMVRLLDTPKAISTLRPAIMREMCFWLLTGPHGGQVARMTLGNSRGQRLIDAIHALRDRFAEPVGIDELATIAQLSPSAFHRRFKALTAMTPLQYQKQLRLSEARRLMVSNPINVESAAFKVGYESSSQFSREYARMFGAPPRRDVLSLRLVTA